MKKRWVKTIISIFAIIFLFVVIYILFIPEELTIRPMRRTDKNI